MTDTANLALPFIDGSQAQKHVTHNEALRILDAAIQIGVLDMSLTVPPSTPVNGERHVVGAGAAGLWAGRANAIATWEDGAWRFLVPKPGWLVWSAADNSVFAFNGTVWSVISAGSGGGGGGSPTFDDVPHIGINSAATSPNLLSVYSNAALFDAITVADGGTGDARVQISKESSSNTASVVFSDAFSGRAEFGLVGTDDFRLKVSADGVTFTEAFTIDRVSGNLSLPRGVALSGVISPAQITANQNDYNPAGIAAASVLQISSDASRTISGLAGGGEGRIVCVFNVGSQNITLADESVSSSASRRFALGANLVVPSKQAVILRYDGTAARWFAIARPGAISLDGAFGFRNRIINPSGQIWQRANTGAAAITDVTYAFDRWYGLSQSAGVTASRVANAENGTPFIMRLSQANATAQRFGIAQVIESANIVDARGQTVTLSARVSMSASTTLRYALIEWTGTADSVTKDVVSDWTNGTFTPGNFFNTSNLTIAATGSVGLTSNTLTSIALSGAVSGSMNNLLVLFWTDSAQAQNVTLDIGKVQLEVGSSGTPLAFRGITEETLLCQRYFWINSGLSGSISSVGSSQTFMVSFPVVMRAAPTLSINNASVNGGSVLEIGTAQRVLSSITVVTGIAANGGRFDTTSTTTGTTFRPACLEAGAVSFNAEL